jgi:FKBP-type peptidyl-prolyl cis-trans isomerase 2
MKVPVMKLRKSRPVSLCLLPVFFMLLQGPAWGAQAAAAPGHVPARTGLSERNELEKVSKALEDAVKSGSTSINIDETEDPVRVQGGDLVRVNYSASLESGELFASTVEKEAKNPAGKKVAWFVEPERYGAEEIVAGRPELLPGLGDAVIGMTVGEKKHVVLPPEKAFDPEDPGSRVRYPAVRTIPRITSLGAEEYVKRFGSFPISGKEVDLVPFFKAKVTHVGEKDVTLEFQAKDGGRFDEALGVSVVKVTGNNITITLTPRIGAPFYANGRTGRIVAVEGDNFTVDFNNPLAGKKIVLDLELVSLTKASSLNTKPVEWIEDHETGLTRAKKEGKPIFLVLYADWCGWCKKTLAESIPDPRVSRFRDKFVWMKLNSDKETKYKQMYGQNGFPMMVLLRPDGTVAEKIDGFHDGAVLGVILKEFLAATTKTVQGKTN